MKRWVERVSVPGVIQRSNKSMIAPSSCPGKLPKDCNMLSMVKV